MTRSDITIRPAAHTPDDLGFVDGCIRGLAAEEGLPDVSATVDDLAAALFGPRPVVAAIIADVAGQPAGCAVYYRKYSTVTGRRGVHLEDLYVLPTFRGRRVGAALMAHLQELAGVRGMVDWWVMRTNADAIRFYLRDGARELDGIAVYRRDHPDADPGSTRTGLATDEAEVDA